MTLLSVWPSPGSAEACGRHDELQKDPRTGTDGSGSGTKADDPSYRSWRSIGHNRGVPRQKTEELPADVREVVEALRKVAGREGVTRTKLSSAPVLLALVAKRHPEATVAEKARDAEDLIRTHVNAMPNLRDRALLIAGLNIDGQGDPKSYEERIENIRDDVPGGFSTAAEGDGVIGRFRSQLLIELAWRLLGGAATFATPRPPSSDLELVSRLRSQHQDHDAILVLERVANEAEASRDRRDAWRLLATMRYEGGDYVGADLAFGIAMQFREGARRAASWLWRSIATPRS
jgi:hypothetical protein